MTLGIPVTKEIVDQAAGYNIVALMQAFQKCLDFKNEFLDKTAAAVNGQETYLKSLPSTGGDVSYTDDEIATLRAAYLAISQLYTVAIGQNAVPQASNFFWDAPKLIGINVS